MNQRGSGASRAHPSAADFPDLDDLGAAVWVQSYDAAWLGQDWQLLEQHLAPEVIFVQQGFATVVVGRAAVLASLRDVTSRAQVHEYNATDLKGHRSGAVGVITYRWQLDWTVDRDRRASTGRDVLVLRAACNDWQLVLRTQLSS